MLNIKKRTSNKIVSSIIAVVAALCLAGCSADKPAQPAQTQSPDTAKFLLEDLSHARYEEAMARMDDKMTKAVGDASKLQSIWEGILAQIGEFKDLGEPVASEAPPYTVYKIAVIGEQASLIAQVTLSSEGKVAGLFFLPGESGAEKQLAPSGITEEEMTFAADEKYPIKGLISLPDGARDKLRAAVLVHGSGPNDRDESIGANRVFQQLAYGLNKRGIAVLRYDKRTYTYPDCAADPNFTVKEEVVDDAIAAVNALKSDKRIDPSHIYVIGHSLGGMLAPRIQRDGAGAAGLVLMAGSPRKLTEIISDQINAQLDAADESQKEQAESQRRQLTQWEESANELYKMAPEEAKKAPTLFGASAWYFYDLASVSAIDALKQDKTPALILQGEEDFQVYYDTDYALWQQALSSEPYVSFKAYNELNHLFLPASSDPQKRGTAAEYAEKAQIPDEVFDDIAGFIKS